MARRQNSQRQQEKIFRNYFGPRRRPWLWWILNTLLIIIVLHTTIELWWPALAAHYIQGLHRVMNQPYLEQIKEPIEAYVKPVVTNIQQIIAPFVRFIAQLPIFTPVYQFIDKFVSEQGRTSFLYGIGLPIAILALQLLIRILSGVVYAVRYAFARGARRTLELDSLDVIEGRLITEDQIVTDNEFEQLWRGRMNSIVDESYRKLDLDKSECLHKLVVEAPILWRSKVTPRVHPDDFRWRRGRDGSVRFSVYRIVVIHLTDHFMGIFSCYYNFIRNQAMNESFKQHRYADIVSVSLSEFGDDVILTLPSGATLTYRRQFRIAFKNNEKLTVTTNATRLSQELGVDSKLDESSAEAAVRLINRFLRDRDKEV